MISQTAEYALRAVVFLAGNTSCPTSRLEISTRTQVPPDYLMKVLQELDRAGIVSSQRGPGGGYQLAVPPDETSIYDVITVVSPIPVPRIKECPLGIQEHMKLCPLHHRLDQAAELVEIAFKQTLISELLTDSSAALTCKFPIAPAR